MSTKNRLGNARNQFQTEAKRVLCLCSAGMLRSPTLANVLYRTFGFNTRAAGVVRSFALVCVDEVLMKWADQVVFVEEEVKNDFLRYNDCAQWLADYEPQVVTLDLPDEYAWNSPDLQAACLEQYLAATS